MTVSLGVEVLPELAGVDEVSVLQRQRQPSVNISAAEWGESYVCKDDTIGRVDVERLSLGMRRGSSRGVPH